MGLENTSILSELFYKVFGNEPEKTELLPFSGSGRLYCRMSGQGLSAIGSVSSDLPEVQSFVYINTLMQQMQMPVPVILASDMQKGALLLNDLGSLDLLQWIEQNRESENFLYTLRQLYTSAIDQLLVFQFDVGKVVDFSKLPGRQFDERQILLDLNYFKYYFLKPSGIAFNEYNLEQDFYNLAQLCIKEHSVVSLIYRDFQGRNIMLLENKLYFIDFQGARKGPVAYDLASLLFQVKAALPEMIRNELLNYYINRLKIYIEFDEPKFRADFPNFVLLRLLQVMGAYGFRGWFEQKRHFIDSVSMLHPNISWVLNNSLLINQLPELKQCLIKINETDVKTSRSTLIETPAKERLILQFNSFSYRRGIPYDLSGNGGGFVFDCRLLPNPGLLDKYKQLTGLDDEVKRFFLNEPEVTGFIQKVADILHQVVIKYKNLGYTHLQVNFGCTGGRHRSVYCAEQVAEILKSVHDVEIKINHTDLT